MRLTPPASHGPCVSASVRKRNGMQSVDATQRSRRHLCVGHLTQAAHLRLRGGAAGSSSSTSSLASLLLLLLVLLLSSERARRRLTVVLVLFPCIRSAQHL